MHEAILWCKLHGMRIETLSIHSGRTSEPNTGDVAPPLHLSTTFTRGVDGNYPGGFVYARADNPTRRALEQALAALEGGAEAMCFASGSAASLAVFSLLRPGDHVVAPRESYHGTAKQLKDIMSRWGVASTFVDMTDLSAVKGAVTLNTRLLWTETPSNPMLNISDIGALSDLAHRAGALLCCDNTFATPVFQRPFDHGADLVMHSSTKFFGGHTDVMGGVVIAREAGETSQRLRDYQITSGSIPAPFDCWLIRRSLTTLPWRMRGHADNAQRVAQFLSAHANVERVFYPGLETHPNHALARKQMPNGFGGVVSFCIKGARPEAFALTEHLKLFTRATSFGGVESLIEHRASIEGPGTLTPENLLRVSVGLEHPDDLIADLAFALG
jgi:cystathionine gamma-synthase